MNQPVATPITGNEARIDATTPHGALAEFYRAFNGCDLVLMERNWLNSPEASMDSPLGGIRRGWDEISQVYNRIFNGTGVVKVEFFDYTLHASDQAFLAVGRERGTYKSAGQEIQLKIRTTRWFKLVDGRWRQLHHHGSIEDANLLAKYQGAVQ
jgi:ketosteroid isomerase-like protein